MSLAINLIANELSPFLQPQIFSVNTITLNFPLPVCFSSYKIMIKYVYMIVTEKPTVSCQNNQKIPRIIQ
jgi:hypothetical protein